MMFRFLFHVCFLNLNLNLNIKADIMLFRFLVSCSSCFRSHRNYKFGVAMKTETLILIEVPYY